MTEAEKIILQKIEALSNRIGQFEHLLHLGLSIDKIIDVKDDKVHNVMQVVKIFKTSNGVVIHVR
jgi:hypothetical protein